MNTQQVLFPDAEKQNRKLRERNPLGQFENPKRKAAYSKREQQLLDNMRVMRANTQSVARQLRQRDERIIELENELKRLKNQ